MRSSLHAQHKARERCRWELRQHLLGFCIRQLLTRCRLCTIEVQQFQDASGPSSADRFGSGIVSGRHLEGAVSAGLLRMEPLKKVR